MSWKKEVFGKTPAGETVEKYTLTNASGLEASFSDLGGTWLGMKVPDKDGKMADVVLGYGDVEGLLNGSGHLGEIVGRNANRIGKASLVIAGKRYDLAKNNGENNLHSGPDFYSYRIWAVSVSEEAGETSITFSLKSPDMDQGYPGNADISVTYTLTDACELKISYHMVSDADTIANFTNHAYFNLAGHGSGDVLSQTVFIDADNFTMADSASIPTGELTPVAGTPMDFTAPKTIGQDIEADYMPLVWGNGYDHNWALNHKKGELALAAWALDKASGRKMEVYTDLPGIQFYTGNGLKGAAGKDGAVYIKRAGFCFETQYFPDCVNKENFEGPFLAKGEEYSTTTIYKFTCEDR